MTDNGGTYYRLHDDGAEWRCKSCDKLHAHRLVILFENTETKERQIICCWCVDEDWMATAKCIGTL